MHILPKRAKLVVTKERGINLTFKLQDFEGPLDLLLYLIEKNKMSIYDIEIASITDQYMRYIDEAKKLELESMSDFIVMAATLLYMKSCLLLPKITKTEDVPEEDIRAELVEKLLEYKKVKYVSQRLDERQGNVQQRFVRNQVARIEIKRGKPSCETILDQVTLKLLYDTFKQLLRQQELSTRQEVTLDAILLEKDTYTIEEQSAYIKQLLKEKGQVSFFKLCKEAVTKLEIIVTFMALLELVHKREVDVVEDDGEIVMKGVS